MALLSGGGYAQYVAVPEELLMPVPSHLTLYEAAAIPEAWLTAYQILHFIGAWRQNKSMKAYKVFKYLIGVRLFSASLNLSKYLYCLKSHFEISSTRKNSWFLLLIFSIVLCFVLAQVKDGESVLIHAGASGVSTAAIQLARLFHAVPLVTAGSPDKLKIAEKLGAAAGFNYKDGNFSEKILQFTQGKLWKSSVHLSSVMVIIMWTVEMLQCLIYDLFSLPTVNTQCFCRQGGWYHPWLHWWILLGEKYS